MEAILVTTAAGGIWSRFGTYRASKAVVFWSCLACIAATIVVGFTWGGWVTGSTATRIAGRAADRASSAGQAQLAAAICADRFITGPHAQAQTVALEGTDSARRSAFIAEGGWLVLPGMKAPIAGAAELCVQRILNTVPSSG